MLDRQPEGPLMQALESVGKRGFAYAWQMLRNREDALDAVQSALASVWQHRRRLDPARDVRGWFYRVLRNKCVDQLRRRRSQPTVSLEPPALGDERQGVRPARNGQPEGHDPAEAVDRSEALARLRQALDGLPAEAREILLLRDYHDLSYAEIARTLEVPIGTVMSRLHRARCALRERMQAREA